jgi:hypothetical protein
MRCLRTDKPLSSLLLGLERLRLSRNREVLLSILKDYETTQSTY